MPPRVTEGLPQLSACIARLLFNLVEEKLLWLLLLQNRYNK
jgi:hypothetical protein